MLYANETLDVAAVSAGRFDPKLKASQTPLPRLTLATVKARWLGQDGQDATGMGDVHVSLTGLGRTQGIAAAVLTDSVRGTWVYHGPGHDRDEPSGDVTGPMALRPSSDRSALDLFFAPYRDETGATLTLRLIGQDGKMTVARFAGGASDPARRAPLPAAGRVDAKPGDDIGALANKYGTVSLAPGTYRLTRPLVLEKPVTLTAEGKATLLFSQAPADAPWTTAIKIHSGHTTLNGFAVRFEGSIRWDQEVSYGPAVIGTTDNRDQGKNNYKAGLVMTRLDLESPAPADPSKWTEAVRLMRLTNAKGGMIAGNILFGGPIEFFDGPWQFVNNDLRGTPAGTYSHGVFTGHATHDVTIKGNRAKPVEPSGKIWRFLVLTHRSAGDRIEDNVIEDIGCATETRSPGRTSPRSC